MLVLVPEALPFIAAAEAFAAAAPWRAEDGVLLLVELVLEEPIVMPEDPPTFVTPFEDLVMPEDPPTFVTVPVEDLVMPDEPPTVWEPSSLVL